MLGYAVLFCLVACLTLLASFFLPSHLSLKHVYTCSYIPMLMMWYFTHVVDITYEKAKKRTYLPMLTLVALFLPLLCGLLLLYPWLGGRHKTKELQPQDKKEDDEKTELIPATELKSSRDSDE